MQVELLNRRWNARIELATKAELYRRLVKTPYVSAVACERRSAFPARVYMPHAAHRHRSSGGCAGDREASGRHQSAGICADATEQEVAPGADQPPAGQGLPGLGEVRVSTETTYQASYIHLRGELKRELVRGPHSGRAARKPVVTRMHGAVGLSIR